MPKNNVDQAPKVKSKGEKFNKALSANDRKNWGNSVRPQELEAIFATCLGDRDFTQYKIMMFLTSVAEGFGVSQKIIMERCGISKDAYYKNRGRLVERGWLSLEEDGEEEYIVINYDKIYEDGKQICGVPDSEPVETPAPASLIDMF